MQQNGQLQKSKLFETKQTLHYQNSQSIKVLTSDTNVTGSISNRTWLSNGADII